MKNENEIKRFRKSVKNALRGLGYVIRNERNFQIELIIAAIVIVMILAFNIQNWEAIIIIILIMWVLLMELINTVVERVVDILKPRIHPYSRLIKDIMAAVVLTSAIITTMVGIIIFWPYLRDIFLK